MGWTNPPYDDWAKEAELTWWFGKWRDSKSLLGYDFLYKDGKAKPESEKRDDWGGQEYPVDYSSKWAVGKKKWEVWLDAYDQWDHEQKRLTEVYMRIIEPMDRDEAAEICQGKFPLPPSMPKDLAELFKTCSIGDVVRLATCLEDIEVDVNSRDQKLMTPMMHAAIAGSLECVEYLIDTGADASLENTSKDTAFDLAVEHWGEAYPERPIIAFFKARGAPRGHGWRANLMPGL